MEQKNPDNNISNEQDNLPISEESVDHSNTQPLSEHSASKELDVTDSLRKPHSKKKLYIIIASTLVVIAGVVGAYLMLKKDDKPANNQATTTQQTEQKKTEEPKKEAEIEPALKKFITPTTGETWLPERKKVGDQGLLKDYQVGQDLVYYEIGARDGNIIYDGVVSVLGEIHYIFEKNSSGGFRFISQPSSTASYNEENIQTEKQGLTAKVVFDNQIHYDSLSIPTKLSLDNGYSLKLNPYELLGTYTDPNAINPGNSKKITLVKKYGASKLEKSESADLSTGLTSIGYSLTFPNNNVVNMEYAPLNTNTKDFSFTAGVKVMNDTLYPITSGCGGISASVSRSDKIKASELKLVGTSDTGQNLYEVIDPNNEILKKAYSEFKEFYAQDTDEYKKTLSKDEFIKNHSVLFFKDNDNQFLVYARSEYRPQYGCAKPVVYLYPEYAQNVSVKVGADVKISDPLYDPSNGWQNVWADPSGLLSYRGIDYQSLFWEGPGYGAYPVINSGIVVPTSRAVATIKSQLTQQGFNQQEINDFLDYWTPNLPSQPYIRLSWLTTEQMNQLAPLSISPKPNTIIRTFLDFSGLDQSISLPPQKFDAPERQGFTVVEWGGLSHKKLY